MITNFFWALRRSLTSRSSYNKYKIFKDPRVQDSMKRLGYCVTDVFLDDETINRLYSAYNRFLEIHEHSLSDRFYATGGLLETPAGKFAFNALNDILVPQLKQLTTEDAARIYPGVFQIKPSSGKSELIPHRDSSLLNEKEYYGISVWVGLVDCNEQTGALYVLPGSHKYGVGNRSASASNELEGKEGIITKYCRTLKSKRGQVVLFDNALIHGSLTNSSGQVRVAVSGYIFPKSAPLSTPVINGDTPTETVNVYEVNESYFADIIAGKDVSSRSPLGKQIGNYPTDRLMLSGFEWELLCRLNRVLLASSYEA